MRGATLRKWLLRLGMVLGVLAVLAVVLVRIHVHRIYGGLVEEADPEPFRTGIASVALVNVRALSPDGERFVPGQTVVVRDGRIDAVSSSADVPEGVRVIDGKGRYLIPGLIDGHVHLRRQPNDLLLYLANGVTTVRDFAGGPHDLKWREEIAAGRPGPRL